MVFEKVVLSLPTGDRGRAYAFFGPGGLGLPTPGDLAEDGVPEPLQVVVNECLTLMLIPTGGFGWTVPDHTVAERGVVECQLSLAFSAATEVDAFVVRWRAAGGAVAAAPSTQPWGYAATLADPDGHLWMVLVPAAW